MGGVGKTQVTLEYAYRQLTEYQRIFWIDAANLPTFVARGS
jgi:hypothetical protein